MVLRGTISSFQPETGRVSIETPQETLETSLKQTHDYCKYDNPRRVVGERVRVWINRETGKVSWFERAPYDYGVLA